MGDVKKLLILGGTGFIGREICRKAIQHGFEVTSLSRRGRISGAYLTTDDVRSWESKVQWRIGSALDRGVLQTLIAQHDAVIHSIGILFESSLNQLVSGASTAATGTTYELANRDTALVPLKIIASQSVDKTPPKPFAFVSASVSPPLRPRYLTSKLEVEEVMRQYHEEKKIRSIILRPGVVHYPSKWTSLPLARLARYAHAVDTALTQATGFSLGTVEPTPLDLVVTAILRAIAAPDVSGAFNNEGMRQLILRTKTGSV